MQKKFLIGYFLVFIMVLGTFENEVIAQEISIKEVDQLVERTMEIFKVPGIGVSIIKDGKIHYSQGYGIRSLISKEKVDENTLFGIASNTKAFTTAAIGILVEEDNLNWDDKVVQYVPEFKMYNEYVTQEFTIRDLLTHRSGLGLGAGDLMFFPDSADFTIDDIIHNLRYLKPVSDFRTKYDYDNLLYMVAGEVVTRVSGKPWEQFVEERIMKPIGMYQSAASFSRIKNKSNVIEAHAEVEGTLKVIPRYTRDIGLASGGIYSNIAELSKWVLLQLNRGKFGTGLNHQLFREKTHEEMWTPHTIIPVSTPGLYNTHFRSYGLGWFISDIKGYIEMSHTGGLPGMVSQVTILPEMNLGIIVLTNQQSGEAFRAITNQIKDHYLGIEGNDWVNLMKNQADRQNEYAQKITGEVWAAIEEHLKDKSEQPNFDDFTGTYRDLWFGDIKILIQEDNLWFTSKRSPKLTGELIYYKDNTFIVKWVDRSMDADAFVRFDKDEKGKASGITMKPVSPLTDFSYDFQDLDFVKVKD
jgi:CubicO group peptidase (beta-lactamase class C family)